VQVLDWPPPHPKLRCGGHWYHQLSGPVGAYEPKPRNICLGGPGITLRTKVARSLPPTPGSADTAPRGQLRVFVAWPQIVLVAANGAWISPDGGVTWSIPAIGRQRRFG
jgi:hypothetical protein